MPPILRVRGLEVAFTGSGRAIPALRGIDLDVHANEVVGIVGESGSGKSVASLAITGLLPRTARVKGSVILNGREVVGADAKTLRAIRGDDVGMIFQDPTTSLNPVLPVGWQVTEGEVAQGRLTREAARARAADLLRDVDIANPEGRARQYPHEFSGGMRQRAGIAMAMARHPKLIIADEPTTALDVTVQAQVLEVLSRRQAETGAGLILITHDLGVVAEIADRVAVMYCGRIVEEGSVEDIFSRPRHPYTAALLRSIPRVDAAAARLDPIPGQPPNPVAIPTGCSFHPRCAIGRDRPVCAAEAPALRPVSTPAMLPGASPPPQGEGDHAKHGGGGERANDRRLPAPPPPPSSGRSPSPYGGGDARPSMQRAACHFAEEVDLLAARPRAPPAAAASAQRAEAAPILEIENLQVHFPVRAGLLRRRIGIVKAVDGVSLVVRPGETVSLVGESGCGKTTTARAAMGLVPATGGTVRFGGRTITGLSRSALREVRREMQYVFQDPFASLNPVLTAGEIVAEPLRVHGLHEERGGDRLVADLFEMVGLSRTMTGRYPAEFSGGQKQRIGIARALALKPRLLILDEPVAALDVSIQAQIVNLLQDLQRELALAYLFIAHDLSVVRHISDRVAVMYLGRIVEESGKTALYETPVHPYTQSLLSAVPVPDPGAKAARNRIVLKGEIPNPAAPPAGCAFHPRCFRASPRCAVEPPPFVPYPGQPTQVACHHAGPLEARSSPPPQGEGDHAKHGGEGERASDRRLPAPPPPPSYGRSPSPYGGGDARPSMQGALP